MVKIVHCLTFFTFVSGAWAQTGSVTGKIVLPKQFSKKVAVEKYAGKISGEVARMPAKVGGIWLSAPNLVATKPSVAVFGQKGYQFEDSLLVVPVGTTVQFPNHDPDYHNIYSLSPTKRFDLGRYKKSEQPVPTVTFTKPGLVRIRCEIHAHMEADFLVVDSPYYTKSNRNGEFELQNIPAGTYALHAQFGKKKWSTQISVKSGQVTRVPKLSK